MTMLDCLKQPSSQSPSSAWRTGSGAGLFVLIPLLIAVLREMPVNMFSSALNALTLADLPPEIIEQAGYVMAIPLGSFVQPRGPCEH